MGILSSIGQGDKYWEKELEKYNLDPKFLRKQINGEWAYHDNIVIVDNDEKIEMFPFYLQTVYGSVSIISNGLQSLNNFPRIIYGDCNIHCSHLTSLKGGPEIVNGSFSCNYCKNLISLEGGPSTVRGSYQCYNCENLVSLKGCPRIICGDFNLNNCINLSSLRWGPDLVWECYCIGGCKKLKTMEGFDTCVTDRFVWEGSGININNTDIITILEKKRIKYYRNTML